MVGKQITVPFRSPNVMKKLKALCSEVLHRAVPVEAVATAVQIPNRDGMAVKDDASSPRRKKRDYLNRERVIGVQQWMSSFLPVATEMVDRPLRFGDLRDRLRLHGSIPLVRSFSEQQLASKVAPACPPPPTVEPAQLASSVPGVQVPPLAVEHPVASDRLGWILQEIARVPKLFYRTKHEKSVHEGRRIRREVLMPVVEAISSLTDLRQVARSLVKSLSIPSSDEWKRTQVESFISLVKDHPEIVIFLSEIGATKALLRVLSQTTCHSLQGDCRLALAFMGYSFPVKGKGIKILSLDGGGTRGVVVVEVLKAIERETGKSTHELFDYIVGVSTGAILTTLLGPMRRNLDECEDLYMSLCRELFSDPGWWGTGRLFMSHSLYDTAVWEQILNEHMGDASFEESAADPDCPKIGLISAVVRKGVPMTYVFRNYTMPPGYQSRFSGNSGMRYTYREAVRASSAAPGVFREAVLDNEIHLDGGTNCNNPTSVAIHECRNIWPGVPIQAVVSIGNGIWDESVMSDLRPHSKPRTTKAEASSLWDKLSVFFNSATDTERVHITLRDLLPRNVYFRCNPLMSENIRLDESDPCKLEKLQEETVNYLRRNRQKLDRIVEALTDDVSAFSSTSSSSLPPDLRR